MAGLCEGGNEPVGSLKAIYMKCKNLGLFKAEWEAHLQHANNCRVLALSANPYVTATRDLITECNGYVKSLQLIEASDVIKDPRTSLYDARRIREKLREKELQAKFLA
ncbi:hypothetical protein ANN_22522 [Periplaneta americana]|uniref:Uncharacterized protein n=1 Tax=Periplaneta americana TaxID=6978 RepID=A0ABQ8S8W3_PERAM|nr:hypothetical protein ANN_22522 [Periplaneta americana]